MFTNHDSCNTTTRLMTQYRCIMLKSFNLSLSIKTSFSYNKYTNNSKKNHHFYSEFIWDYRYVYTYIMDYEHVFNFQKLHSSRGRSSILFRSDIFLYTDNLYLVITPIIVTKGERLTARDFVLVPRI